MSKGLTPKQQRFVDAYLVDLNATQAYIRAGYMARGNAAEVNAARLLRNAQVTAAIAAQRAKLSEAAQVEAVRVVKELACIVFSDVRKVFKDDGSVMHPREFDDATAAAVASIEFDPEGGFKIKFWDKNSAADKLMKHLGGYERDNKQKTDPLSELLKALPQKSALPVVKDA